MYAFFSFSFLFNIILNLNGSCITRSIQKTRIWEAKVTRLWPRQRIKIKEAKHGGKSIRDQTTPFDDERRRTTTEFLHSANAHDTCKKTTPQGNFVKVWKFNTTFLSINFYKRISKSFLLIKININNNFQTTL